VGRLWLVVVGQRGVVCRLCLLIERWPGLGRFNIDDEIDEIDEIDDWTDTEAVVLLSLNCCYYEAFVLFLDRCAWISSYCLQFRLFLS
jgi:hypothetical protein